MNNRIVFSTSVASLAIIVAGAAQATETLYLGGYGGSVQKMMEEEIIPPFEKANDVDVQYVAGQSTATLAKLEAQKSAQELDVVFLDDGPMYQAVDMGFCSPLGEAPVYDDVYPIAKFSDSAVAWGIVATGIAYNTDVFQEKGWEPPTSWAALADPKYKGMMTLLGASSTTGLHGLIMTARSKGGGEEDIDPGFAAMKDEVRPNLVTFAPSAPKVAEMFQTGEVAIALWNNSRVRGLAKEGFPVAFVYPEEGAGALMVTTCAVVDSNVPELSQKFVQYMLSAEIQTKLAELGFAPVNKTVDLSPEVSELMPYGEEGIAKLTTIKWDVVNPQRGEWVERWNREIER